MAASPAACCAACAFFQGSKLYIFFETKNALTNKGEIGVAESADGGASWKYLGIALEEEWHLSFPYVFDYNGEVSRIRWLCSSSLFLFCFLRWNGSGCIVSTFGLGRLERWWFRGVIDEFVRWIDH